jgi:predicted Rossmann fold flavoprotein
VKDAYDIAVIGAGPAGLMAAIRASELGRSVAIIEKNDSAGKKLLITGKGRCNVTNSADMETFVKKFGSSGRFFRNAFYAFSSSDLIGFLEKNGVKTKTERQGRVFPEDDRSSSIVKALERSVKENGAQTIYGAAVKVMSKGADGFLIDIVGGNAVHADKVILATGGASYKATGSTGDGFRMAKELGHSVKTLRAELVPLVTDEAWVKDLQGLGLENVSVTFVCGKKKVESPVGEVMFTHFGVSGPLILDLSGEVTALLDGGNEVRMFIDLKPGLREEQLESKLLHKFASKGHSMMKNIMKDVLPNRLIPVFLKIANISQERTSNQVTKDERRAIIKCLKALPLTIKRSLAIEEAMVTGGGVSKDEIDPRTMQSKIIPGLYFAGEIIEGAAPSGGYNLQQAFSTGYLAGERAANA